MTTTFRTVFAVMVAESANNPTLPYGFTFNSDCFAGDGSYQPMEIGKGLTCATFVIALFHSAGFPIIKRETWKHRSEDAAWQKKILALLQGSASSEHIKGATNDVGQFRYWPEEVAAAAVHNSPPLGFDECQVLAAEIMA